jgi:glutathione S-transferase
MSKDIIKFYSFIACPYAIRTRTALEELNIPYEYHEVDLFNNR